jgi:hypothetical protein
MQELLRSLLVIRDSLEGLTQGKPHQILPLFGQLRALLAEKSKDNQPLLLDLAGVLKKEVKLWAFPGTDQDKFPVLPEPAEVLLRIGGLPLSTHKTSPNQQLLSLREVLDQKMLVYRGRHFSRRQLIKLFAEKTGGAHFPKRVPAEVLEVTALEVNGAPAIHQAIVQFARAIFECAATLLRELCDFSVHFYMLVATSEPRVGGVIFDASYPNTAMRIIFGSSPLGQLTFTVIGLDGFAAQVASERLIDWSTPHHVAIHHHLDERLDSRVAITVDGDPYAEAQVPHPVFLTRELNQYRRFMNRSLEDAGAGVNLGLLTHLQVGGTYFTKVQCVTLKYFEEYGNKEDEGCIFFPNGSFGECDVNETTLRMTGSVRKWSWRRLAAGELPTSDA